MREHYEKIIVACCFLFMMTNLGFTSTAFSVYQPHIVAMPDIGDERGSIIVTLRPLATMISVAFASRYYDRFGCRIGVSTACLMTACAFLLYGLSDGFYPVAAASFLSGIGYGLGSTIAMTLLIERWFADKRGAAVGIAAAGSGFAGTVIPPLAAFIIESQSLRTAFWTEGLIALGVSGAMIALLRNDPKDIGRAPYRLGAISSNPPVSGNTGDSPKPPAQEGAKGNVFLSPAQYFAMLISIFSIGGICSGVNYLSMLFSSNGFGASYVAALLAVGGLSLTLGKILSGKILDRLGTLRGSIAFFTLLCSGCLLCIASALLGARAMSAVAVILFCGGAAIASVGIPLWSLELSNRHNHDGMVRNFQLAYTMGLFVFSLMPGFIAGATGSYAVSYAILLVVAIPACVYISGIYRNKLPTS